MAWQSIGIGMMEEMHHQAEDLCRLQSIKEERDSLYSRITDLERGEEKQRKKLEEVEHASATEINRLEAENAELKRKLEEAEGNVALFQENAKKAELDHLDALASLRAEKIAAVQECTELRNAKKGADAKCHSLTLENVKLQQELKEQIRHAKDLADEVQGMTDQLDEAYVDSFSNCIKQLQFFNPGVVLNLKGVAPVFAFDEGGTLMNFRSGKPVDLKDPELPVFDPDQVLAPGSDGEDGSGEGDRPRPSQTDSGPPARPDAVDGP